MKGVTITPLTKIPDDRGCIFHMMRNDSPLFKKFGEIYFSTVYPGVVKAWHIHSKMTLNYVVIKGNIKLAVLKEASGERIKKGETPDEDEYKFYPEEMQEIYIGDRNFLLVTIEPGIWNGFMGIGTEEAIVANLTDIPHDKNEIRRLPFNYFNYNWSVKNR